MPQTPYKWTFTCHKKFKKKIPNLLPADVFFRAWNAAKPFSARHCPQARRQPQWGPGKHYRGALSPPPFLYVLRSRKRGERCPPHRSIRGSGPGNVVSSPSMVWGRKKWILCNVMKCKIFGNAPRLKKLNQRCGEVARWWENYGEVKLCVDDVWRSQVMVRL